MNEELFRALVGWLETSPSARDLDLHGDAHWRRVAWTAVDLGKEVRGSDPLVAFLFGLLHDSMRQGDGTDPEHGRRAEVVIGELNGRLFHLSEPRAELLSTACAGHADGLVSDDPTIGVCWDADRLDLWRLDMQPRAELLSSPAARSRDRIAWARGFTRERPTWDALLAKLPAAMP